MLRLLFSKNNFARVINNIKLTIEYIQYAQRGFCLFHDTTADDFSLSRTNAVDVRNEKYIYISENIPSDADL